MVKRISFFWGNEKMSLLRYMTLVSFRKLNPDWRMRLFVCEQRRHDKYWDCPNQQDFFAYSGPDYTDRLQDIQGLEIIPWEVEEEWLLDVGPSHKSNFFKWDILGKEDGVYADMDIVFIKPITEWYEHIRWANVGICYQPTAGYDQFSIGLLSSYGPAPFYDDVYIESIKHRADIYQNAGVMAIYRLLGPHLEGNHWSKMVEKYPESTFTNFEMDYIYPKDCTNVLELLDRTEEFGSRTFGIHWYAGHERMQKFNSYLDEDTIHTVDNTLTEYLRRLL